MLSWVKISRSCAVFFKKSVNFIILTFYFLSGQTWQYVPYYILPDNKINDWVCSSGFLWIQKKICLRPKKTRWGNPIVNLIIRGSSLRHILSRLTRQEMTIWCKKSDGFSFSSSPFLGGLRCLSCSLQFAHCDQIGALYFLANILRSYLFGILLKPQLYSWSLGIEYLV